MRNCRIPSKALIIGALLLTPFAAVWANATQKPAAWLEWDTTLTTDGSESATLIVMLTSRLPTASTAIELHLPDPLNTLESPEWQGELNRHTPTQLHWTLTGPIDFSQPVGINVTLTLPQGDTVDHHFKAEWSTLSAKPANRTLAPAPALQYRNGEALSVMPLNSKAHR